MNSKTVYRPRLLAALLISSCGIWILHGFLIPLTWAVILALTSWPLFRKLELYCPEKYRSTLPSLVLTLLIGVLVLVPAIYALILLSHELQGFVQLLLEAQNTGFTSPGWLKGIPLIGDWANDTWATTLGNPQTVREALHDWGIGTIATYTRSAAEHVLHSVFATFIALLTLFFTYRNGSRISSQIVLRSIDLFGPIGSRYISHAATAIQATVSGLVLVGLGIGVLLGLGYTVAGLPHPVLLGAVTGVFAMIPFAAKLVFGGAALVLFAKGSIAAGTGLLIFGVIVIFAADNYIRPALIGGAVKLPFLWTLLGIFGGIENFGLIGLFVGPTIMAVLMSVWRDWMDEVPAQNITTAESG